MENINVQNQVTENTTATQEREPIDRTNEVLIDNSTSFDDLLRILNGNPEAIKGEELETEVKEFEAKEAELIKAFGDDYEKMISWNEDDEEPSLIKAKRRPGAIQLRNYEPMVAKITMSSGSCEVFDNGYAVYDNGDRKTVIWVPDCGATTYYFNPLRDSEREYLTQKSDVGEDVLGPSPWYIAIMIAGENSIESNLVHPKSKGTVSDWDNDDYEKGEGNYWSGSAHIETPEEYVMRMEADRERKAAMTDKQNEVYELSYEYGYTEEQIADELGISRSAVRDRLECIWKKFGKEPEKFF